jgi:RNA polymerase sigma-70 factor, ECF subfamily
LDLKTNLAAVLKGDRQAFAAVVQLYQGPLFGFLGRMGFSQALAEDLAQEAFLRAWQHLARFDPDRAKFVTWLFAIARNLALTELERPAHRLLHGTDELIAELPADDLDPSAAITAAQQKARLQSALRELTMDERSTLGLAYVQELDMATIARIEHCSVAAVKTRLHRAKLRLRNLFDKDLESNHERK